MTIIRGSLDVVSNVGAMGWAFTADTRKKLTVQAMLNHAIVGEAIADIHRADLAAVGMGDGNCGFKIDFYQEIDPLYLPFIVVKISGGDVELPRASLSGYSDYFTALYRKFPVTARHRSVFGGLWTDRIDAVPLMKDRIDVGILDAAQIPALSAFIQSGFAVVDSGPVRASAAKSEAPAKRIGAMPGRGKTPDLTEAVGGLLRSGPVLDLLKAILEGLPIAVSSHVVEGSDEGFRQPSAMEVLRSPAECVSVVVSLDDKPFELDIVRESHLFSEFSTQSQSRWTNPAGAVAIDVALKESGLVDRQAVPSGSAVIVGPGLIHRVRTQPEAMAVRVHCIPSRVAPLDRLVDGSLKETQLESGARVWR